MNDKTKQYKWLPWVLAIAIAVAIAVVIQMFYHVDWYFLDPWTPASGLVTLISINEFSAGLPDTAPYWNLRLIALTSLVVTFIVAPLLWIYAEIKNQSRPTSDVLKKGFAWYIGVILMITSLQVVPTSVIKGIVMQNSWERSAESKNQDQLRTELMKMGYEALEHFYLPKELGGGAGSFLTFPANDGDVRPIQLKDLENYKTGDTNSYTLAEVNSDSSITIYGIGYKQGTDPEYVNADGRKGKVQIALEVNASPSFNFRNENTR